MPPDRQTAGGPAGASWLPGTATAAGLVVSVTALNVDRQWRLAALLLGASGVGVALLFWRRTRRRAVGTGVASVLLLSAAAVLVVSPSPAAPKHAVLPRPGSKLSLSQLQVVDAGVHHPTELDITVHNTGGRRAVLDRLVLTVNHFAYLPQCVFGSSLEPSRITYPVTMPDRPRAGQRVSVVLHEEVGPDQVDRFQVKLHAPPLRRAPGGPAPAVFAYQLDASVTSDVEPRPLALGPAIVTVDHAPTRNVEAWDVGDPGRAQDPGIRDLVVGDPAARRCLDRNSARLASLLALPGARVDGLVPAGLPSS